MCHLYPDLPFLLLSPPFALSLRFHQTPSDLSLLEVNEWLDKLVSATPRSHAKRKEREKEGIFTQLSSLLNPQEMKWLVRGRGRGRGAGGKAR